MDAIALLKKDHRTVKSLFSQFDKLGDGAHKQKKAVVQQIIHELSVHAAIEEALFYPTARAAVKAKEDLVLEALEEHHVVKWLLHELASLEPTHERYDAKVTVLKEAVNHHVEEEESDLFPAFERKVAPAERIALGSALEAAKKVAPTRPHPSAPDAPPGNLVAGIPSALIDKVRDLIAAPAVARVASRGRRGMTMSSAMPRMGRAPKKSAKRISKRSVNK